jgi:hypothetical protein
MADLSLFEHIPAGTVASPAQTAFLSGAGMSAPDLPLGDELTMQVLRSCCGDKGAQRIVDGFRAAHMTDRAGRPKWTPRLEGILQDLIPLLGDDRALAPLRVLGRVWPNARHAFFARHLLMGGRHLTVNFDDAIERAGGTGELVHLHGLYAPPDFAQLGVEIARLSRGLSPASGAALRAALTECSTLVICGYSGRDYFDIDPWLLALADEDRPLTGLRVIWIDHQSEGASATTPWVMPRALEAVMLAGATAICVRGDTTALLRGIARDWGIPWSDASDSDGEVERAVSTSPLPRIDRWDRYRAQAAVLMRFGMGREIVRLSRRLALTRQASAKAVRDDMWAARRDGYALTGRYRRAIWITLRHRPESPEVAAHRWAVCGALLGQRGSVWSAGLSVSMALRAFDALGAEHESVLDADARMHWLNAQRERSERVRSRARRPGVFFRLADRAVRLGVAPETVLRDLLSDNRYLVGWPHTLPQVQLLLDACPELASVSLPGNFAARLRLVDDVYFETDSIIGSLNFGRRAVTRGAPDAPSLDDLLHGSAAIGDRPGHLRSALLLRSAGQDVDFPWSAFLLTGWSYWRKRNWLLAWRRRDATRRY